MKLIYSRPQAFNTPKAYFTSAGYFTNSGRDSVRFRRASTEVKKYPYQRAGSRRGFYITYQFFSEWIGAGMRPPRAMKRSQEEELTAMTGA